MLTGEKSPLAHFSDIGVVAGGKEHRLCRVG
jgi:hypothetical protein